ncbi:MAG: D-aminoacyl-tRNA deacylase [Deltaproteobacteria bacterium]|jgi:D-tyrosyl-tRNA(Tyr) deacylase|nr:D-aminoacyl-tRNA deacylase [Deltaproteobacteria bacterium]
MLNGKKAVYYLADNEDRPGLVSRSVWKLLCEKGCMVPAGIVSDGREVMLHKDERDNEYFFVPTEIPICLDYPKYLPFMNGHFGDCDVAGMITWHEGGSAPEKILTVHSIGDVETGIYGPGNPVYMRNLLCALERGRVKAGLEDFQTVTEATHWSGSSVPGSSPELIAQYQVPLMDIEVGSEAASWTDLRACGALADALTQVFDGDGRRLRNLLCLGGTHFDPNFATAVFTEWGDEAFGVSHILANQWLVSGDYERERGVAFASAAVESIDGGIAAIAFHDKLKGCYKDLARALGEKYGVPLLKHQRLRNPGDIVW